MKMETSYYSITFSFRGYLYFYMCLMLQERDDYALELAMGDE